jgi:uncharacterized protein YbaP (TraB family)
LNNYKSSFKNSITKYFLVFILLFALAFPCYSCASPDAADEQDGKSFIWKVSDDDSFVYLLGSIHIASSDIYPLDSSIEDAFQESDRLVVEINIKEVGPITTMLLLEKYGTYPAGENLKQNLDEELYKRLETQLQEIDVSISAFDEYRPWVILTMFEGIAGVGEDYSAEYGIDVYFMEKADERGMGILELETVEYQIKVMSDLPDELMILLLEMSLEPPDMDDYIDVIGYMFAQWEKGNTGGIEELVFEDLEEEPALAPYYESFLTQRNHNMADKIEEYLAEGYIYFIVVGAGHLVGEEGLLSLLEEAGYKVEQL